MLVWTPLEEEPQDRLTVWTLVGKVGLSLDSAVDCRYGGNLVPAVVSHESYGRSDKDLAALYTALSVRGRPGPAHCLHPVPVLWLGSSPRRSIPGLWSHSRRRRRTGGTNHRVKRTASTVTR